jgi:membrane associated rhomboid family serine protease
MGSIWDDLKLQFKMGDVTTKLIFWNIGIYLVSLVFFYDFREGHFDFPNWLSLSSDAIITLRRPWTLVTYAFFHNGFMHLLFNMLVLNFSGRMFLTFFTQKQLFGIYILGAIFSGLAFITGYAILDDFSAIVGASGAIMAVLIATATYAPTMEMRLMFLGRIKLWHFAAFVVLTDLVFVLIENTGGHIAHLAGALFGFLYIRLLQRGLDLSRGISYITELFQGGNKSRLKKVHRNYKQSAVKKETKIVMKDKAQQQIDEILDKISRSGYESLTKDERDFLFRAGKE